MEFDKFTIGTTEYRKAFWDKAMRGQKAPYETVKGGTISNEQLIVPYDSYRKYMDALKKESLFRGIATCVYAPKSDNKLWTSDADAPAEWIPEGCPISINDKADVFVRHNIMCNKLTLITRLDNDYIWDIGFDIEAYMIAHLAKRFSKAEENAFINGTGGTMPHGILHDTEGAEIGVTTSELTYDDVIKLYFATKAEYRKNGVWLMNDETALALRTMKDKNGNYLWNHANDTILGKCVLISEYMPSVGAGAKMIAFGDFSYYWIVNRRPLSIRSLFEKFAMNEQVGYLACEYLDGKLIRPEAVKVLRMSE